MPDGCAQGSRTQGGIINREFKDDVLALRHIGYHLGQLALRVVVQRLPTNKNLSAIGHKQVDHQLEQCALARSVGPHNRTKTAFADVQVDMLQERGVVV